MTPDHLEPQAAVDFIQGWKAMSRAQRSEYNNNLITYVDSMIHQSEILVARTVAKARYLEGPN